MEAHREARLAPTAPRSAEPAPPRSCRRRSRRLPVRPRPGSASGSRAPGTRCSAASAACSASAASTARCSSELEALLFAADLGVKTAEDLLERVRREAPDGGAEAVRAVLRKAIAEKLARIEPSGEPLALAAKPHVMLVLGVNGSGKTTTIGKLAARYRAAGCTVRARRGRHLPRRGARAAPALERAHGLPSWSRAPMAATRRRWPSTP